MEVELRRKTEEVRKREGMMTGQRPSGAKFGATEIIYPGLNKA